MAIINSVLGPLDTNDMGLTLMHEHIASLDMSMVHAFRDWVDIESTLEDFTKNIEAVKQYGVKTMIDHTPINLGRDIDVLRKGAQKAKINIICATGLYFMEEPFIMRGTDADCMAGYFIRDIIEGIQGTEYKAAFVKVATDKYHGESEVNQTMMIAAAITAKQTGCPISTHTQSTLRHGVYQQDIFLKEGVKPYKIYIGHSFDCLDEGYLRELMDKGSYVGCDQIGIIHRATTEQLADIVAYLIKLRKGYEKQICLSHDSGAVSDYAYSFAPWKRDSMKNTSVRGYDELFKVMLPLLKVNGVSQEEIDMMLIENPRRFFAGEPIR